MVNWQLTLELNFPSLYLRASHKDKKWRWARCITWCCCSLFWMGWSSKPGSSVEASSSVLAVSQSVAFWISLWNATRWLPSFWIDSSASCICHCNLFNAKRAGGKVCKKTWWKQICMVYIYRPYNIIKNKTINQKSQKHTWDMSFSFTSLTIPILKDSNRKFSIYNIWLD